MKTIIGLTGALVCVLPLAYALAAPSTSPVARTIADFTSDDAAAAWLSINDNVMGGVSSGGFRITDSGTLLFSGNISLENRGGFASIRTRPEALDLEGYTVMAVRVKGDGRTYYLDLRSSGSAAGSYRTPLETVKDTWHEFRIPLERFEFAAFGRRIASAQRLTAGNIQSVGFTLADSQSGPFRMEVDWIRGEIAGAHDADGEALPVAASEPIDIVDTAVNAGQFRVLVQALAAAGLVEALKGPGPFTVFAPDDEAFARLPEGTLETLLEPDNRAQLTAILTYHVVAGELLLGSRRPATLEGGTLSITPSGAVKVNDATVLAADLRTSNGVIHVIDRVLIPPAPAPTPTAKTETAAVIELAIARGVPLFNAGQPAACAAIYEVAVEALLKSHAETLTGPQRSVLESALDAMRREQEAAEQSWILRRAMDTVLRSISGAI